MAATAAPESRMKRSKRPKPPPSAVSIATSHRIKVRCLIRMAERPSSPAMIGRELGVESSMVSYHARILCDFNLVEVVEERPVRGAIEHFYRTVAAAEVNEEEFKELPEDLRKAWVETVFGLVGADAMHSVEEGILPNQFDCEIYRTNMKVDPQGYADIKQAFIEVHERVRAIKGEAETRLAEDGRLTPRPIISFNALFEVPPAK